MDIWGIACTVFLGLVLGSFATALSFRLPRDISILTNVRSKCTSCNATLGVLDLVPLFSWLALKGRCRHCGAGIGWQYPLIELATLALCLLFYAVYGFSAETLPVFFLAPVIVSMIDIDLRYKIIPDGLNLSVFLLGAVALFINALTAANPPGFIMEKGAAALGAALLYGALAWLCRQGALLVMKREAMGLGDVKFFAAAGFWLGLAADSASLLLIVSGMSGVFISIIWKKITGESEFPFGPSLAVGFIAALCLYPPQFIINM